MISISRNYSMTSKGRVLIGGGTGFVGKYLKQYLKNQNYDVTIISRKNNKSDSVISWDQIKKNEIPHDTVAVINAAGEPILEPTRFWTSKFKKTVWDSRVMTNQYLVDAINKMKTPKPKLFISFSGVGIYPPNTDKCKPYTESYDVKEFDYLSKLAIGIEKSAIPKSDDVRSVIIRLGVVFGRHGGFISQLYPFFRFGLGICMGNGSQFLPWIHIDDVCRIVLFSIENNGVEGIVNGVAPEIITHQYFAKSFVEVFGHSFVLKVPGIIFKLIFGRERAKMVLEGQAVEPTKLNNLNFVYKLPDVKTALCSVSKE
ncbi:epimerase family protein SDR39U1-like [Melanaphis sacchari]|uniref:epimerase family protein SDR39U1-like n=1 Tax=Melanaphis sacchari TaxID=742174 RepID=UPI000DC1314F|nr:epimerase family protein SDR39U1-like [Melanaphis sacchari]XP_025199522.1 epimerase family protein SDR39U1-like [Melanaphis sacchari]